MRLTKDEWAMKLALITSKRSTCARREVGCVLLNFRGHVLSTGYNGVAVGLPHCNEMTDGQTLHRCSGADSQSGTNLDGCQAIHAEQNALLQCHDVHNIHTCYVTTSPCLTCVKLLLNTSCEQIIFMDQYSQDSRQLWLAAGRGWRQLTCCIPT